MGGEEEDQGLQDDVGHTGAVELAGHQEHQHCRAEDRKKPHPAVVSLISAGWRQLTV